MCRAVDVTSLIFPTDAYSTHNGSGLLFVWTPGTKRFGSQDQVLCYVLNIFKKESYGIRRKLKKGAVPSVSLYKVLQGVHLKGKARLKILKEPLPDHSEEVATEDHDYSLKRPLTISAEKLAEVQEMLPVSKPNNRTIKKREGLQLIDTLVKEKLLSEETECLL